MMDGPHILGFSAAAARINLTKALASARLAGFVRASMNAATLNLVGLVLFCAIRASCPSREATMNQGEEIDARRSASGFLLLRFVGHGPGEEKNGTAKHQRIEYVVQAVVEAGELRHGDGDVDDQDDEEHA